MKKTLIISLLILITVALGFIRDAVFIPINENIKQGTDTGVLKWILTLIFTTGYFLLSSAFLWVLYKSYKYIKIAAGVYLLLLFVSFLIVAVGYLFSSFQAVYSLSRAVMGVLQSPVIAMVLLAFCYMEKRFK